LIVIGAFDAPEMIVYKAAHAGRMPTKRAGNFGSNLGVFP
jgi:hypothetical protein